MLVAALLPSVTRCGLARRWGDAAATAAARGVPRFLPRTSVFSLSGHGTAGPSPSPSASAFKLAAAAVPRLRWPLSPARDGRVAPCRTALAVWSQSPLPRQTRVATRSGCGVREGCERPLPAGGHRARRPEATARTDHPAAHPPGMANAAAAAASLRWHVCPCADGPTVSHNEYLSISCSLSVRWLGVGGRRSCSVSRRATPSPTSTTWQTSRLFVPQTETTATACVSGTCTDGFALVCGQTPPASIHVPVAAAATGQPRRNLHDERPGGLAPSTWSVALPRCLRSASPRRQSGRMLSRWVSVSLPRRLP